MLNPIVGHLDAGLTPDGVLVHRVRYTHIFARTSSDHQVYFTTYTRVKDYATTALRWDEAGNGTQHVGVHEVVIDDAPDLNGSQRYVGKYIATSIICTTEQVYVIPDGEGMAQIAWSTPPELRVFAANGSEPTSTGPVRVLRWDNITTGQVITVECLFDVMCETRSAIMPFIQRSVQTTDTALTLQSRYFARLAFRSSSVFFSRVYILDWYLTNVLQFFESQGQLTDESLLDRMGTEPSVIAAGQAAGLFEGLGNLLRRGASTVGRMALHALPDLVDSAISSIGEGAGRGATSLIPGTQFTVQRRIPGPRGRDY